MISFDKMLFKLSALVRYCIEPIQTNPNNQFWNDKTTSLKDTNDFKPQWNEVSQH